MRIYRREMLQATVAVVGDEPVRSELWALRLPFVSSAQASLAKAKPIPSGPFQPTWDSIRDNFRSPG